MFLMISIFAFMNLEKRFHLFQDFLIDMSNGAISYIRSFNLEKLARPKLRYETNTYHRDTFHMADIDMMVHVTNYILKIEVVAKCNIDEMWCKDLVNMFRGTFSSLLPANCMVEIVPLTNEPILRDWFA